jgi:rhamnulokinase
MVSERTNASTTQCWDPVAGHWATDVLERLEIPTTMLPSVVEPGTALGALLPEWRNELGGARVITPATHDTGSAIAATPVHAATDWAYISSGTWSLVGAELPHPLITPEALAANWTNEGGVLGTTRFLKNVMGLWLLQECQRAWAREQQTLDYDALVAQVDAVPAYTVLIDPDDPRFLAPEHMPTAINEHLRARGLPPLQTPAAFARCIMESLVLRYSEVLRQLEALTGRPVRIVHVLGGGSRNARLNQWLADAFDVPVIAGPAEATALGNALMQLVGLGELRTLEDVRTVVQRVPTQVFEPRPEYRAAWNEAAGRFAALTAAAVH